MILKSITDLYLPIARHAPICSLLYLSLYADWISCSKLSLQNVVPSINSRILTKKTREQVEADLLKSVCDKANVSLTSVFLIYSYLMFIFLILTKPMKRDDPPSMENIRQI